MRLNLDVAIYGLHSSTPAKHPEGLCRPLLVINFVCWAAEAGIRVHLVILD